MIYFESFFYHILHLVETTTILCIFQNIFTGNLSTVSERLAPPGECYYKTWLPACSLAAVFSSLWSWRHSASCWSFWTDQRQLSSVQNFLCQPSPLSPRWTSGWGPSRRRPRWEWPAGRFHPSPGWGRQSGRCHWSTFSELFQTWTEFPPRSSARRVCSINRPMMIIKYTELTLKTLVLSGAESEWDWAPVLGL